MNENDLQELIYNAEFTQDVTVTVPWGSLQMAIVGLLQEVLEQQPDMSVEQLLTMMQAPR